MLYIIIQLSIKLRVPVSGTRSPEEPQIIAPSASSINAFPTVPLYHQQWRVSRLRSTGHLIGFDIFQYLVGNVLISCVVWVPLVEVEV